MGDSEAGVVLHLRVRIPRGEVLRYMGYPRSKGPAPHVQRRLEELLETAPSLLDARGAFVLADRARAESTGMPKPSELVAFGVCTIGPALEAEEDRLSNEQDVLGALIADAIGSASAEQAAELLHARVCRTARSLNLKAAQRLSPGYGRWNVAHQADLLAHLPISDVGVRLTDSSMMIPRKSVSFAVLLVSPQAKTPRVRCAACDLAGCRYRRDEQDDAKASEETES
jgi:hypothetical protein